MAVKECNHTWIEIIPHGLVGINDSYQYSKHRACKNCDVVQIFVADNIDITPDWMELRQYLIYKRLYRINCDNAVDKIKAVYKEFEIRSEPPIKPTERTGLP